MTQGAPTVDMGRSSVSDAMIEAYALNGFVKVPNLITVESASALRKAALGVATGTMPNGDEAYAERLTQQVNVWRSNAILKQITMSPGIAAIAEQLAGCELRVWHDHLLSKAPRNGFATEWHQDRPYWPFEGKPSTISVWIALQDTPADLGCMSFMPGSQRMDDLTAQSLADARSLFGVAPELEFESKVTVPLKAGEATFHNGRTAHMANANQLDAWRIAHVTIYMQNGVTFSGKPHGVTAEYSKTVSGLTQGDALDGAWFPRTAK
ncbi:MAG: phytanoyl-CoA dioxygenase family protein [Kiritimatiellae bacterium]|nr:phytanoyl-CoA dioxygenase family protein [Kiritimatiellia bacterium]